jgi:hypothetical protein
MTLESESDVKRNLSHASLAFDTNSRKNTSLLLYNELTIKSINRCTCVRGVRALVSHAVATSRARTRARASTIVAREHRRRVPSRKSAETLSARALMVI